MKKRVLVAVSGGIAAYKACDVVRRLQDAGCDVRVAMTEDACKFVGPITFEALSHHPVLTDLFEFPESPNPHIMHAGWADICSTDASLPSPTSPQARRPLVGMMKP